MMILGQHEMLDPAGMGLMANLIGLVVSALAIFGINRARSSARPISSPNKDPLDRVRQSHIRLERITPAFTGSGAHNRLGLSEARAPSIRLGQFETLPAGIGCDLREQLTIRPLPKRSVYPVVVRTN